MTKIKTNRNNTNNVPHLRFPEFSGEWEKNNLSKFSSKITKKNKGNVIQNVLCNSANLGIIPQNDYFDRDIANADNTDSYYIIEHGDFVYNPRKSTAAPYGPVNIYNGEKPGIISPLYLCFSVLNISPSFLFYRFKSSVWHPYVYSHGDTGVRFDRVSIKDDVFFDMPIYTPTQNEQEKIATLLSLIDERIATQNKIIEKLETLIKAIGNKCLFGHGRNVRLGDILIERTEKSTINDQYEILSSTIKGIFSQRNYFSKDIASENNIGYKILHKGDIVLSPQNLWMGNINYNDKFDFGIVSPSYKVFAISKEFDCLYVAFLLKTHRSLYSYRSISEQGASIVRRNLNMDAFLELTFKIPPFVAQRQIGQALSKLSDKIEMERDCLNMLKAQKQYLLSHLFI